MEDIPITENLQTGIRPSVLEQLRALACAHGLTRLILFGSRARGDFSRGSDIDLALSGGKQDRFRLDTENGTDTLLTFDFVDLDGPLQPELRKAIETEGIVLYEKI